MNKKTLLLACALVLPMSAAYADKMEGKMCGHGHHAGHLAKALGLNADQQAKLDEIFKEEHEKFKALHEESHSRIKDVLTPEQQAKWEKMMAEHKGQHGMHHQHGGDKAGEAAPSPAPAAN
jgi:Spy/CpxP family protein refolding chaperone